MTADACASDYVILILSKYMWIFVYPLLSVVDKDSVVYCLITVWKFHWSMTDVINVEKGCFCSLLIVKKTCFLNQPKMNQCFFSDLKKKNSGSFVADF